MTVIYRLGKGERGGRDKEYPRGKAEACFGTEQAQDTSSVQRSHLMSRSSL